jgi:hypothetical protein
MRLYIAGPMTGYPEFNYPAFYAAETALRKAGFDTLNPARSEGREGCKSWLDYMRAGLRDVADCDGVALLPGWEDSRGAALEAHVARSLDLPVRMVDEWLDGTP